MENKKIPYLCGGTLFFLLVQAKKPRVRAREREKGISDNLSDPAMMGGLIQAITGDKSYAYKDSLKKNTSQFRECRINGSIYIPFNDPITVNGYDEAVKKSYDDVLLRMRDFANRFLDHSKSTWLVRALLDVIDNDKDIKADDLFCVQRDASFISKSALLGLNQFEVELFLIGVIHYILKNRSDNISGQDTLDAWGTKANEHSERKVKTDFALGSNRTEVIVWCEQVGRDAHNDATKNATSSCAHEEREEEKVSDDGNGDSDTSKRDEGQKITVIRQQTNVVQTGKNNFNLVNNGTINLKI